jgi:hypothetical protein
MYLFDDISRDYEGPSGYAESHYAYLNRSARPEFGAVRDLVEDWLGDYPKHHRTHLITRLKTQDDLQFEAAFFELYLHHIFRQAGASVQVHPYRGKGQKRPDFRVTMPGGSRFIVEAITVTEGSFMDRKATDRLKPFYDALNRVASPDFFFHVRHFGLPQSPIPGRRIRGALERWLQSVDYEQVRRHAGESLLDGPTMRFTHDGCELVIALIPVSDAHRGVADHRPVGAMGPGEAQIVDYWTPIRDAIKSKATRYGRLRQPYLIAINALDQSAGQIDVMQALFGQEAFTFRRGDPVDEELHFTRVPNGAWVGKRGPINTRVSAVMAVGTLVPWTVAVSKPEVYFNPWAAHPLSDSLDLFDAHVPVDGQVIARPGRPVSKSLRLPTSWPQELMPA